MFGHFLEGFWTRNTEGALWDNHKKSSGKPKETLKENQRNTKGKPKEERLKEYNLRTLPSPGFHMKTTQLFLVFRFLLGKYVWLGMSVLGVCHFGPSKWCFGGTLFPSRFSMCSFGTFWVLLVSLCPPLWTLWAYFWGVFSRCGKRVRPKSFLACFLAPAHPRQPRYSLSQTQFCTNQRFPDSVVFLVQKTLQNELSFDTF